jgi:hypothetical protein
MWLVTVLALSCGGIVTETDTDTDTDTEDINRSGRDEFNRGSESSCDSSVSVSGHNTKHLPSLWKITDAHGRGVGVRQLPCPNLICDI